jgi:nucleotide sugar dehydrogenase
MAKQICVIGLGYVGEHLISSFSECNEFNVIGFDINNNRLNDLRIKYKNCKFTNDENDLKDVDLFCISVPTLLNKEKNGIENGPITSVKRMLLKVAKRRSTIVIESSIYVGGTRELFSDFLKCNIYVGFSPERVDPGRVLPKHSEIPKVVSGLDNESCNMIIEYYSKIFKRVVPVSSTECAEMCKLYENCFRLINISYTNEISDLCADFKIDPFEMINACSTKPFGFLPFTPGLGVGGHCIPVNPYYITKGDFKKLPCLEMSLRKAEMRPEEKAKMILNDNKNVKNILVVGAAFKPGETLLTNSPAIGLSKTFIENGLDVYIHDPLVKNEPNICETEYSYLSMLNPFSLRKGSVYWLKESDFTVDNILNSIDIIIICMKQHNINWDIIDKLERLDKKVYWFINRNDVIF